MAKGHSDKLASGSEGGWVDGKEKGVGWADTDRKEGGQEIENKTDRQMFSFSFLVFHREEVNPPTPQDDITFHIPHELFPGTADQQLMQPPTCAAGAHN